MILILIRICIPYFSSQKKIDNKKTREEIDSFQAQLSENKKPKHYSKKATNYYSKFQYPKHESSLFYFDPNSADSLQFLQLGLSPKQAKVICNFRKKGGKFYKKTDFQKMYCINEKLFNKISKYIQIDSLQFTYKSTKKDTLAIKKPNFKSPNKISIVELNDADSLTLKKVNGIGSRLAKRIINYREKLGGFIHKKQLLEVFGVDTPLYHSIENQLVIDTSNVRKININKVYYANIKYFPYLNSNQAIALINYRNRHGAFQKLDDIKKCVLIDDFTFNKVKTYFALND
jgi:DNA uptake protein ComE-like DNA-binding protein